jgi:alpha-ketoglutarate-dependent taurine dioxygenase
VSRETREPEVEQSSFPYEFDVEKCGADNITFLWRSERSAIEAALLRHGSVLFKNAEIDTAQKFQNSMDVISGDLGSYIDGNSPRTKLAGGIYTSTEYPPELSISLHNELSYSDKWPARLYFCCVKPAATGGSTTIADSRLILQNLPPAIVKVYESKGVMYVRNLPREGGHGIGKTWQQTFETTNKADVELHCAERNIKYDWSSDGGLKLIQIRPSTAVHPTSGDSVWFNQADQFHPSTNPPEVYEALLELYGDEPMNMPQYSCFGDGTPIPDEVLVEVRSNMEKLTVAFPWRKGDMMVVDNMLAAHGRSPFTGDRNVLVSMSK